MILKKTVSIVIPNYNGKSLLKQYLPYTLTAINNAEVDYEVIVVDDCSKDTSVQFIKSSYPQIKILQNTQNSGFSYTCNRGIHAAQMDLVLLLNSDVKLSADYFEHLWSYFSYPDTFGVMGCITDMNGPHIQDAARMPDRSGFKLRWWFYEPTEDNTAYTLYLSGANALIDTKKLKAIGGFNTLFSPFYGEDFELSLRAWRLNWTCYYEKRAVCGHEMSASTKNYKTARWVKMIYFRNRYYLHALHLDDPELALWFMQITFIDLLPKILIGQFWIITSYYEFIKHIPAIKRARFAFKQLMNRQNNHVTLPAVIKKIKASVQGKPITRIK